MNETVHRKFHSTVEFFSFLNLHRLASVFYRFHPRRKSLHPAVWASSDSSWSWCRRSGTDGVKDLSLQCQHPLPIQKLFEQCLRSESNFPPLFPLWVGRLVVHARKPLPETITGISPCDSSQDKLGIITAGSWAHIFHIIRVQEYRHLCSLLLWTNLKVIYLVHIDALGILSGRTSKAAQYVHMNLH